MANQITGRIIEIGQTVQIPSKNGGSSFTKREFILDATTYDPYTGERSEYENVIPLEFSGDKLNVLILTVLVKVMLLPCHSYYKDVLGRIKMENLSVWLLFGAIK